jgi:GNAT superfamily N-acetyltransferase
LALHNAHRGRNIIFAAPVIRLATSAADYAAFGGLCRAYVGWCRQRYADMPWFVEGVFGHQSLDDELQALREQYGPPAGRALLATTADGAVAGGAWRRRSPEVCELKRLYVGDGARGLGLGRRLSEALIASARGEGFAAMQLDTADRLTEAIAMYASMGFECVAPYQTYPEALMPHLIFMRRDL